MNQDQWSESDARRVLGAAARSGLSLKAYGDANGISIPRLYWWRRRLRDDAPALRSVSPKTTALVPTSSPMSFVELSTSPEPQAGALEVVLSNGRMVRVPSVFDDGVLVRVLAAADRVA